MDGSSGLGDHTTKEMRSLSQEDKEHFLIVLTQLGAIATELLETQWWCARLEVEIKELREASMVVYQHNTMLKKKLDDVETYYNKLVQIHKASRESYD